MFINPTEAATARTSLKKQQFENCNKSDLSSPEVTIDQNLNNKAYNLIFNFLVSLISVGIHT
jgi:hypothetical protein